MREIKFRARKKDSGELLGYFDLYNLTELTFEGIKYNIGNIVFEQFTELKDKNGKEIYEGDIVNHGDEMIDEVVFGNYIIHNCEGMYDYSTPCFCIKFSDSSGYACLDGELEVIGNIYENPELLKPSARLKGDKEWK